jgi:hypothetical protein
MKIDANKIVDEAVQQVLPWDLIITVGDVDCVTRPLTVGDVGQLAAANSLGEEAAAALVKGLFVDPQPDVMRWSTDELMVVIHLVCNYFKAHLAKNSDAITKAAAMPFVMEKKK